MNILENLNQICSETSSFAYTDDMYCTNAANASRIDYMRQALPLLIELVESQGKLIESLKCGGFFREDSPGLSRIEQARAKLEEAMR